MKDLKKIFLDFLSHKNINNKSFFLIAVSGGIDSMVCLHIANELNLNIGVAHVNFQLRNNESDYDAELIENYCTKQDIPFHLLVKNAKEHASEHKLSIQESARNIRYTFFNSILESYNYQYVVTAHHLNDNIETLFINLNRGSGLKGLSGIPSVRDRIIRPLLSASKNSIIEYADMLQIAYREDSSNKELKYDRNYIRNIIIPSINDQFPTFNKGVQSSISAINQDYSLLMDLVNEKISPLVKMNGACYHIEYKNDIPELIWYHYLRKFGFNYDQVKDLVSNNHQSGKKFISDKYTLYIDRTSWLINDRISDENIIYSIPFNSSLDKPIKLHCSPIEKPTFLNSPVDTAYFDADKLTFPLQLRKWLPGDKIKPIGMKGTKKISDLLIDQKTSIPDKNKTYVLLSNNKIIWVIGKKISADFLIDESTNNCYKIMFLPH